MHAGDRSLLAGLLTSSPPTDPSGLAQTAFSQQRLEAWRPLFTPFLVAILTGLGGLLFLGTGISLWLSFTNQLELEEPYDQSCGTKPICNVTFHIPRNISDQTTVLAYRLTNYPQNHQRYFTSRSYAQLRGVYVDYNGMDECGDYRTEDPDDTDNMSSWILPCGAVARSFFNDTYHWVDQKMDDSFNNASIAWRSDRQKLFKKLNDNYTDGDKWLETEPLNWSFPGGTRNEQFIVWMREAILQTFMKPYARCSQCNIEKGDYVLEIGNNYRSGDLERPLFQGERSVVLTTVGLFGSKNMPLAIAYFAVGGFLMLSCVVIVVSHVACPRPLGEGR